MTQYQIAVLVGSFRSESSNRKLANGLCKLSPTDFTCTQLKFDDLPLYNQDHDNKQCEQVARLKREIKGSHGLLFVTPEYNRSIPGVLKNAIDHASRPYGESAWTHKPAGMIGVSMGTTGTAMAQQHLRNILSYLDVPTLSQPEAFIDDKPGLFDENGDIGTDSKTFLQTWMNSYAAWVRHHAS